jgi:hypothetical protein
VNKLSLGLLAVTLVLMTAGVMFAASALTGANQAPDAGGPMAANAAPTQATTDWRIPNPKDAASTNAAGQQPTKEPASGWRASLPERRGEFDRTGSPTATANAGP